MTELDEKDLDRVDAYHRGELSATEEAELRERIGQDPGFAEIVRQQEILLRALEPTPEELAERAAFRSSFLERQQLRKNASPVQGARTPGPLPAKIRPLLTRWLAGAAAMLLIGLAGYWASSKVLRTDVPAQAAVPYFTPLNRLGGRMGSTPIAEEQLAIAYKAYDTGDYATAAPLLNSPALIAADSLNLLFGAVANLGLGNAEAAANTLESLRRTRFYLPNQAEIDFYLALAYLNNGEREKGLELLRTTSLLPGIYGEEAGEVLKK